jgi:hypothetical protein
LSAATVKHLDPTQVELEISIEQAELDPPASVLSALS